MLSILRRRRISDAKRDSWLIIYILHAEMIVMERYMGRIHNLYNCIHCFICRICKVNCEYLMMESILAKSVRVNQVLIVDPMYSASTGSVDSGNLQKRH